METKPIATQSEESIVQEFQELCDAALSVTDPEKLLKYRFEEHLQVTERERSIANTPWISRECKIKCMDMAQNLQLELHSRRHALVNERTQKRTDIERFADICRDAMTGWYEYLDPITIGEKKMYDALRKIHQAEDIPRETIKEYEHLCEEAKKEIELKRTMVIKERAMGKLKRRTQVTMEDYAKMIGDPSCRMYLEYLQYLNENDIHDYSSLRLVEIIGLIAHYSKSQTNDPSITEDTVVATDVCRALRIVRTTLLAYAVVGIDDLDCRNVVHTLLQKSYEITKPGGWFRDFYYKMFPDELIVTEDSDEE